MLGKLLCSIDEHRMGEYRIPTSRPDRAEAVAWRPCEREDCDHVQRGVGGFDALLAFIRAYEKAFPDGRAKFDKSMTFRGSRYDTG